MKSMAIFFSIVFAISLISMIVNYSGNNNSSSHEYSYTSSYSDYSTGSSNKEFDTDRSKYMPGGDKYDPNWYERNHKNSK